MTECNLPLASAQAYALPLQRGTDLPLASARASALPLQRGIFKANYCIFAFQLSGYDRRVLQ